MEYFKTLKEGIKVLFFKEDAVHKLADSPKATKHGFLTLFFTGLIISIWAIIFLFFIDPTYVNDYEKSVIYRGESPLISLIPILLGGLVSWLVILPLVLIFFIAIYHLLARYLGRGQASLTQYFRVAANACIVPVVLMFLDFTMLIPNCSYGVCPMYSTLSPLNDIKNKLLLLWLLLVNIVVLKKVYGLSSLRALIIGLLPPALFLVAVQIYDLVFTYMTFGRL